MLDSSITGFSFTFDAAMLPPPHDWSPESSMEAFHLTDVFLELQCEGIEI